MKTIFLTLLGAALLAGTAVAGPRFGVYVNSGGGNCGPRFYAAPACYAPRVYYPAPVCFRPAPVYYYSAAPVIYVPVCAPVYRAPIVTTGVNVGAVSFGWRR